MLAALFNASFYRRYCTFIVHSNQLMVCPMVVDVIIAYKALSICLYLKRKLDAKLVLTLNELKAK